MKRLVMAALLAAFACAPSVGCGGGRRARDGRGRAGRRASRRAGAGRARSGRGGCLRRARSGGPRSRRVRWRRARRDLYRRQRARHRAARGDHRDPRVAACAPKSPGHARWGSHALALVACVLASGCYHGSARTATPADLADQPDGWNLVEGVPPVRQIEREDCGAAALAMVLGYWGSPITRDAISAAKPAAPEHGIRAAALRDFARRRGLQAFLVEGQLADSRARARPASPGPGRCHEAVRPAPLPPLRGRGGREPPRPARPHARSRRTVCV